MLPRWKPLFREALGPILPIRKPRVVIVGRPNVGKSTLFNRLCRRRRSITDPTPGVTRDVIEEDCILDGMAMTLVDTGGIKADYIDEIDQLVASKTHHALNSSDAVLFLLEVGKVTAEDHLLASELRRHRDKVILVINKVDNVEKDYMAAEFHALGFGTPIPLSAEHGRNIDSLSAVLKNCLENAVGGLNGEDASMEKETPLVITLAGKPNTGKSTLSNRLVGIDASLVSAIPGTTRDAVTHEMRYKDRLIRLNDTAGMRRKAKVTENIEYYSVNRALRAMMESDVTILLIDKEEGLSDQDKKISAQAVKKGRAIVMAFNKWDEENPDSRHYRQAEERIRFQFPILEWAPLVPISALKGYGISKLMDTVLKVDRQQNKRVETSVLNQSMVEWQTLTPAPTKKGRPFKVKYITQVSTKPVMFLAFVNRITGFPDSYRRFLINQIRQTFGFTLIPVEIELKEGRR